MLHEELAVTAEFHVQVADRIEQRLAGPANEREVKPGRDQADIEQRSCLRLSWQTRRERSCASTVRLGSLMNRERRDATLDDVDSGPEYVLAGTRNRAVNSAAGPAATGSSPTGEIASAAT